MQNDRSKFKIDFGCLLSLACNFCLVCLVCFFSMKNMKSIKVDTYSPALALRAFVFGLFDRGYLWQI